MKIKYKLGIRWIPAEGTFVGTLRIYLPCGEGYGELDPWLQSPEKFLGEPLGPRWGVYEEGFRSAEVEVGRSLTASEARGALRARLEGALSFLRTVVDQNALSSGQDWQEEDEVEI